MKVAITVGTLTGPFRHGITHHPAVGLGRLEPIDVEQGLYYMELDDDVVEYVCSLEDGWSWEIPGVWADDRGEKAIWKDWGGNIFVGVTMSDIEMARASG